MAVNEDSEVGFSSYGRADGTLAKANGDGMSSAGFLNVAHVLVPLHWVKLMCFFWGRFFYPSSGEALYT